MYSKKRKATTSMDRRPLKKRRTIVPTGQRSSRKEYKNYDRSSLVATDGSAMATESINLVSEGTLGNEMIGRKITITSIDLRFNIRNAQADDATLATLITALGNNYRLDLVLDKRPNGAGYPGYGDIYANTVTYASMAYLNLANSDRFQILKTWSGTFFDRVVWNGTNFGTVPEIKYYQCHLDVRIPMECTPQAGASRNVGEITRSNIFFVMIKNSTATENIQLRYVSRIRFTDD